MKKLIYITTILFVFAGVTACTDPDLPDITLQNLPGYVSFDAPGQDATIDPAELVATEGQGDFEFAISGIPLSVECPTGNLEDLTVDLGFFGDATFGVDYDFLTGTNISLTGATVILENSQTVNTINDVELDLQILDADGVATGDRTLTISIVAVSSPDGTEFAIGRGGQNLLRTVDIVISDDD